MNKIPIDIEFSSDFENSEEFIQKILSFNKFQIPHLEYFEIISKKLLNNEIIDDFCLNYCPLYENMFYAKIFACNLVPERCEGFPFISTENFETQIENIIFKINSRFNQIIQQNSGFNFYKKYLNSKIQRVKLAEAYFYTNKFSEAISTFENISESKYYDRLIGLSLIFSDKYCSKAESFDLLIINKKEKNILNLVGEIQIDLQKSIFYWLSNYDFDENINLYILYINLKYFLADKNIQLSKLFLNKIKEIIRNKIYEEKRNYYRNSIWKNLIEKIESEYFDTF